MRDFTQLCDSKQNNIGLIGAVFASFWEKSAVSKNFLTVSVKLPKIYLFHVTKPKNEVFSVIDVPLFIPSFNSHKNPVLGIS